MIYKSWPAFIADYGQTGKIAVNRILYLSTAGPFGDGSNPYAPLDASSQPKLDAIWANFMTIPPGGSSITFQYAPGLYQTKGWLFQTRETLLSNNTHAGAGVDKTIIQLVGASSRTADGLIFSSDGSATPANWSCHDMTLDCNAVNQPKWTGAGGYVGAINSPAGKNINVRNVKFINWGTPTSGIECFVLSVIAQNNQSNVQMSNIVFDSCIFTQPATGNHDGVTVAGIADYTPTNCNADSTCIISNCQFFNCASDFIYQHCYGAPTCIGNYAANCNVGFYLEPAHSIYPGVTINVQGNTCVGTTRGVLCLMHNGTSFNNIIIQGNSYNLNNPNSGAWIVNQDSPGSNATINTVTVQSNRITSGGGSSFGVVIDQHSLNNLQIQNVIVHDNVFTGYAGNSIDLDPSTSVIVNRTVSANTIL